MKTFALAVACAVLIPLAVSATTPTPAPKLKMKLVKTAAVPSTVSKIQLLGDLDFAYKPGEGQVQANTYCLTCHSSAYVSSQPPLDKDHWTAEVTKMTKVYGATIPDADAAKIADYLATNYGPKP